MVNCISVLLNQCLAMMILTVTPTVASTAYLKDLVVLTIMTIVTQLCAALVMGIATQEHALLEQFVDTIIF